MKVPVLGEPLFTTVARLRLGYGCAATVAVMAAAVSPVSEEIQNLRLHHSTKTIAPIYSSALN